MPAIITTEDLLSEYSIEPTESADTSLFLPPFTAAEILTADAEPVELLGPVELEQQSESVVTPVEIFIESILAPQDEISLEETVSDLVSEATFLVSPEAAQDVAQIFIETVLECKEAVLAESITPEQLITLVDATIEFLQVIETDITPEQILLLISDILSVQAPPELAKYIQDTLLHELGTYEQKVAVSTTHSATKPVGSSQSLIGRLAIQLGLAGNPIYSAG